MGQLIRGFLMNKITENTLIPISLVVTILGGVVWLTMIYQKVEASQHKLTQFEQAIIDIATIKNDIQYIKESINKGR